MPRILTYILSAAALLMLAIATPSCEDDFGRNYGVIPEGYSTVDIEVGYQAFTSALESRAAGNAIKTINMVWLVIYDTDGHFIEKRKITNFTPGQTEARPEFNSSETATGCAKFSLTYPNGRYYFYAVVNHDLSNISDDDILTDGQLMQLPLTWDANVTNNSEMFGWFVNGDKSTKRDNEVPQTVEISPNASTSLHAWVKRAASKVTIAFNTSKLNENVFIYLKSVAIIDAPKHCYLASTNNVGQPGYTLADDGTYFYKPDQTIYFKGAEAGHKGIDDHKKWPMIASGDSVYGLYSDMVSRAAAGMSVADRIAREHTEASEALYFYENMQPNGDSGTESDKWQVVEGAEATDIPTYPDGNKPSTLPEWKDDRKFGTYIEVKAYYENIGTQTPGKGDIVYRFMLGKDTHLNYEAERNHHYKVTMTFLGNANDVDFHIDYDEEAKPGLYTPDTYVPYLYNQPTTTTVRATPLEGYVLTSIDAYIIDNEWRPLIEDGENPNDFYNVKAWQMQEKYEGSYKKTNVKAGTFPNNVYTKDHELCASNCEFGFLSLHEVKDVTRLTGGAYNKLDLSTQMIRDFYYHHKTPSGKYVSLGKRSYTKGIPPTDGTITTPDSDSGNYTITRTTDPHSKEVDYVCILPLYTRAKTLGTWEVYSGANSFYQHHRYARILYVANYKKVDPSVPGTETYSDESISEVRQARRIDNPRGIYRKYNNKASFNVDLMYELLSPASNGACFESIVSRGPWTATIEQDEHSFVSLTANGKTVIGKGNSVSGRTNTKIQFTYTPVASAPENQAWGAIITVTYHNNSCVHKILVRQGYAASSLGSGTSMWSAFNVYDSTHLTKSPLSVGSLFRRYNTLGYPILESNVTRTDGKFGYGEDPGINAKFKIGNGVSDKKWVEIPSYNSGGAKKDAFTNMKLINSIKNTYATYRLPECKELPDLGISITGKDLDSDINFAFGICYADGAYGTLSTSDAYSYTDPKNEGKDSKLGARGVIAYSKNRGDNVFFPFGITGHARRKSETSKPGESPVNSPVYGLMRYGSIDNKMDIRDFDFYRPMAWDLPSQMGAPYWINNDNGNQSAAGNVYPCAIDFNAGNYMVAYLVEANLLLTETAADKSTLSKFDAAPIKPIRTDLISN